MRKAFIASIIVSGMAACVQQPPLSSGPDPKLTASYRISRGRFAASINVLRGLLCIALLSGCAPSIHDVNVKYVSTTEAMPVREADSVNIKVSVSDGRTILKDRIGHYGFESRQGGLLISQQNIPRLIKDSFETELLSRGFHLSNGHVFILIELTGFYSVLDSSNNFKNIWTIGDVSFNVQVLNANACLYYAKRYVGGGNKIDVGSKKGDSFKQFVIDDLQFSFSDAIKKVMADEFFLQSIIDAQRGVDDSKCRPVS